MTRTLLEKGHERTERIMGKFSESEMNLFIGRTDSGPQRATPIPHISPEDWLILRFAQLTQKQFKISIVFGA